MNTLIIKALAVVHQIQHHPGFDTCFTAEQKWVLFQMENLSHDYLDKKLDHWMKETGHVLPR